MRSDVKIYFFSGTGNAQHCAEWFRESAKDKTDVDLVNIEDCGKKLVEPSDVNEITGFCSPTHGFNYPPLMFHFILRFPSVKGRKVFLMNTRAGTMFGKFMLPGLSGIALLFSALILKFKGYEVIGMRPFDLPSNWTLVHWGFKKSKVESMFQKRKREVKAFASKILEGKSDFRGLRDVFQDLLVAPIALMYYLIGRFFLAKTLFASSRCNFCNICVERCPVEAIKKVDNRLFWTWKCENCMRCMNICPQKAVNAHHGFILFFLLIFNFTIHWSISALDLWSGSSEIVKVLITNGLFIGGVFGGYRMCHWLMGFKKVATLFDKMSLSGYKFWKRYRGQDRSI